MGRLDLDGGIGVLEQGRFHLERGRLDVDQDIGDLHQGILDLDSPGEQPNPPYCTPLPLRGGS